MKTELIVKKEIDEVTAAAMDYFKMKDYAAFRRMVKKKQELNFFLLYLETKPSEEFLKKDLARLENRLEKIELRKPVIKMQGVSIEVVKDAQKAATRRHEQEWDVPKLLSQIKAYKYLLGIE